MSDWSSWSDPSEIEWSSLDYEDHLDPLDEAWSLAVVPDGECVAGAASDDGPFSTDWLDHASLDEATWQAWDPSAEVEVATTGPWPSTSGPFDDGFP